MSIDAIDSNWNNYNNDNNDRTTDVHVAELGGIAGSQTQLNGNGSLGRAFTNNPRLVVKYSGGGLSQVEHFAR
jgi:hypothetical protein